MAHNCEMLAKNAATWGSKVRIIGISIDDDLSQLKNHVTSKGWGKVEHYFDGESGNSSRWGVTGVPNCALVGKDGTIVWRGHPATVDLEALINAELAK